MNKSYYEMMAAIENAELQRSAEAANKTLMEQKLEKLAQRTEEKSNKLGLKVDDTYTNDVLIGYNDADSAITANLGGTRTKIPGSNVFYDAIEGAHYKNGVLDPTVNIYGVDKSSGEFGKSDKVMAKQRLYVAATLGKDVNDVTQQDFIDVSNQQLIQKLANDAGSPDWEAPLVRNVVPTNLTGTYINDKGEVEQIPLNVPIMSKGFGKDLSGKRELAAFATADGIDTTLTDAMDPTQNINADRLGVAPEQTIANMTPEQRLEVMNKIDETIAPEGMVNEAIDIAQSSLIQQYGKTNKALRKGSRWLADKIGLEQDTIDKWLPETAETGTIGFGDTTSTELAKQEVADKLTGIMAKTREEQQVAMKSALDNVEKGDYLNAAFDTFKILPYILGDSTGEIASMFAGLPGITTAVAARVSEDAETYKENNGTEPDAKWLVKSALTNSVALFGERFLIKSGIAKTLETGKDTTGRLSSVGLSSAGETVQEWYDQVQQEYNTQKEGTKLLKEVATNPESQLAALTGGVMGATLKGTGELATATAEKLTEAPEMIRSGIEKLTETETQRVLRETREFSEPLRSSAIEDAIQGNASEVVNKAEQIHGKMVDIDSSAPKSMTYATIFRNALNKAIESGDENAIANVYKTMGELDKNEDVDFSLKKVVEERAYEATKQFLNIVNDTNKSATERMDEIKKSGAKVAEGIGEKSAELEELFDSAVNDKISIEALKSIVRLKGSLEKETRNLRDIYGSEEFDANAGDLNKLIESIDKYLETKDLTAVNKEFMELGYIEKDADGTGLKANPSKPGLKRYLVELKRQMFDTKTNQNLLNDKVVKSATVSIPKLVKFAESRLNKLYPYKLDSAYQTNNLMNRLVEENKNMSEVVLELIQTASKLNIDQNKKDAYVTELEKAAKAVVNSANEIARRQKLLDQVQKPAEVKGQLAFEVDKAGNESIIAVDGDNKTKLYDVKNGEIVGLETAPQKAESTTKTAAQPEEVMTKDKFKEEAVKVKRPPETVLGEVREKIGEVDKTLAELIKNVDDMNLKATIKSYYANKLNEVNNDKAKLVKLMDRAEKVLDQMASRKYGTDSKNPLTGIIAYADKLIKAMIDKLANLRKRISIENDKYANLQRQMVELLGMINDIEYAYEPEIVKTTAGTMKKYADSPYGPMVELGDKRVKAKQKPTKTGKLQTVGSALSEAAQKLVEDKIAELDKENTLGAKLVQGLLKRYMIVRSIHRIIKRSSDSIFGKMDSKMFGNPKALIENLPKSFKEVFMSDEESRKSLLDNFKTMDKYINSTSIGDIKIGDKRLINHIDKNGLVMYNVEKDGKTHNFPVEILEILGEVKDGKLQLNEQTETILKFYSAKLIADAHKMVGLILSMNESEMGQVLGITDPDEQLKVRQDAQNGYVAASSIRGSIGNEVYQSLGIKFDKSTPEFTEESFKAALGLLVQNIIIDNGSVNALDSQFAGKNQKLIKVNWDSIAVDKTELVKAMAKLQYLNENRSRPLPSTTKPAPRDRMVMNTQIPINERDNARLNDIEQIAYTISPRLKRWLEMDEKDALKAMGYIDVENAGLHVSEQSAQEARNDKLIREWEILKTFAKGVGNKKFYLNWGQTVSGRFTILNDIQYQESKLHREFVVAEGSTETVDVNNADDVEMLKASILQGLDMDPDKLSLKTATAKFDELFKVTNKGIEVTKDGAIKTAYEALKNGKVDAEAMGEVFADSEGHHGLSAIELLVEWDKAIKGNGKFETHANLEIDAITSGMILTLLQIGSDQAIKLAEKGGVYTKERLPELTEYVKKWLGKDVEFTPGALIEAGKAHAKTIEDAMKTAKTPEEMTELRKQLEDDAVFKDLYSTIGVAMIGEVQAYKNVLLAKKRNKEEEIQLAMLNEIGELNLKNIRSIAKSPVMVYIYGATTNSIKKKLTYSLGIETLVKTIKKASDKLKAGEKADKEMKFIDMYIPVKKYVDRYGKKIDKDMAEWEKLLYLDIDANVIKSVDGVIRATFGKAIEIAFESRLGFVDRNRDAVKSIEMLVFEAYKIKFADEVKNLLDSKYGPNKHNSETYRLSKDDLVAINAKLTDQGFGHNIVWDEDGTRINQSLNKTGDTGGPYSITVEVGNTKSSAQIRENKPIVNTGAAATIPIHAIDGRLMLDTLTRELNGKYAGGNVYDAVVLGINKAMLTDTAKFYNTNMIEVGFSRSIVADQLTMLENMLTTMDADQKVRMFNAIELKPEDKDSVVDYVKEANRLKLTTDKMLASIELAEEVNKQRLVNSAKEYYSGHLFQMGSGVTKVNANTARAKEFPEINTIKKMLQNRMAKDGVKTKLSKLDKTAEVQKVLNEMKDTKLAHKLVDLLNYVSGKQEVKDKELGKLITSGKYDNNAEAVLEYIVDNVGDEQANKYAKMLLSMSKKAGIKVKVNPLIEDMIGKAEYDTTTNTISYSTNENMEDVTTFLHEYTHALSAYMVREIGKDIRLDRLGEMLVKVEAKINKLPEDIRTSVYGFKNRDEFIAEAMSNPMFREVVNDMMKDKSWWETLKRAIKAVFGMKDITILDQIIAEVEKQTEVNAEYEAKSKQKEGILTANDIIKEALECAKG